MSDFKAKMHQIRFRLGLRPRPRWGSLQRSADPLAGFKGPTSKGGVGRDGEEGTEREGLGGREGWGGKGGRDGKGKEGVGRDDGEGRGWEGSGGGGRSGKGREREKGEGEEVEDRRSVPANKNLRLHPC